METERSPGAERWIEAVSSRKDGGQTAPTRRPVWRGAAADGGRTRRLLLYRGLSLRAVDRGEGAGGLAQTARPLHLLLDQGIGDPVQPRDRRLQRRQGRALLLLYRLLLLLLLLKRVLLVLLSRWSSCWTVCQLDIRGLSKDRGPYRDRRETEEPIPADNRHVVSQSRKECMVRDRHQSDFILQDSDTSLFTKHALH